MIGIAMKFLQRTKIPSLNLSISAISILCLALISFSVNSPMYKAWFGIIDDHIIIEQLKPLRHITPFNLPERLLSDTEIGDFGNFPRYRPFYYLTKFTLISLFGDWASGYYLFRVFVQTLCSVLVFRIFFPSSKSSQSNFQQIFAGAMSLLISANALLSIAWTDITLRLGPSELELTFGVLLAAYAFSRLATTANENGPSTKKYFFLLCAGVFMAIGAKENGLITILPFALISFMHFRPLIQKSKLTLLVFSLTVLQTLLVLSNTLIVFARGRDVYDNPRSIDIMLSSLIARFIEPGFCLLLISTGVILMLTVHAQERQLEFLYLMLFIDLIFLSEGVFYTGSSPALRYQILSQFCVIIGPFLALTKLLYFLTSYLKLSNLVLMTSFLMIITGLYFYLRPNSEYSTFKEIAKSNAKSTLMWKSEINSIKSNMNNSPTMPLIIGVFNSGYDYERTYSLVQFMRFRGIENPVFMKTFNTVPDENYRLTEELLKYSIQGSKDWGLLPIDSLSNEKVSFCIFFDVDLNNVDPMSQLFIEQRCISRQIITS